MAPSPAAVPFCVLLARLLARGRGLARSDSMLSIVAAWPSGMTAQTPRLLLAEGPCASAKSAPTPTCSGPRQDAHAASARVREHSPMDCAVIEATDIVGERHREHRDRRLRSNDTHFGVDREPAKRAASQWSVSPPLSARTSYLQVSPANTAVLTASRVAVRRSRRNSARSPSPQAPPSHRRGRR